MAIDDVSDLSRRVQYTAGAGQTAFTYPFRIFDEGDLDVYVGDVQYTLGTMYSVTGVDNDLGGSVIFTTGLSAGAIVTIYSDTAIDRDTDYQQNGPWTSARLNSELDKFMVISQELRAKISRAIRGSILGNTVAEMPSAADRASKYLWFNASGDPTVVTGDASQPLTHSVYLVYPTTGQTAIPVPADYTPGSYDLSVYLNGLKQVVGVDYVENSASLITLTNPATLGDVIEFSIGEVFDVTLVRTSREEQSFTGLTSPTIALTTVSYTPGAHEIDVFFNGALLATADYTETNSTTITLGFTPVASDQFRVIVGRAVNVTNVSRSQAGRALYPQTAAEIAAGVTPTDYGYAPGDVRRYGADPTGAANSDAAIDNALLVGGVANGPTVRGEGTFLVTTKKVITSNCDFSKATFNVDGAPAIALEVSTGSAANPTDFIAYLDVKLPDLVNLDKPGTGWAGQGTGIRLVNVYNSHIYLQRISNFDIGLLLTSYGTNNCAYNSIFVKMLENNRVQIVLAPGAATSSTNENNFFGGACLWNSSEGSNIAGTRGVLHQCYAGGNIINNNRYWGLSFEGDGPQYYVEEQGIDNYYEMCRWEGISLPPKVYLNNTNIAPTPVQGIVIRGGYASEPIVTTIAGTANGNSIQGVSTRHGQGLKGAGLTYANNSSTANPIIRVYDSSVAEPWAKDDADVDWLWSWTGLSFSGKRSGDSVDRVALDPVNGRVYVPGSVFWTSGSGSPEGVVTAPVGSLYSRTDGGAGTSFYVKESGAGNTGWIAK
jgi:hypothetical protein